MIAVDLKKLSDAVENKVFKETLYDELVKKVIDINTTDATDLVKKVLMTQTLVKFLKKYLIVIMLNILLIRNSVS